MFFLLPCLCFLDFIDPEANKESTRRVTEYVVNLMAAFSEVLNTTESAFINVPPEARVHLTAALNLIEKKH